MCTMAWRAMKKKNACGVRMLTSISQNFKSMSFILFASTPRWEIVYVTTFLRDGIFSLKGNWKVAL